MVGRACSSFNDDVDAIEPERVRAADLRRRREAVRFDLRLGLFGIEELFSIVAFFANGTLGGVSCLKCTLSKGWSEVLSSGIDEETLLDLRSSTCAFRIGMPGVDGLLDAYADSLSVSRDGMDSSEKERSGDPDPAIASSLPNVDASSSPVSSGALNSNRHECGLDKEDAIPVDALSVASSTAPPADRQGSVLHCNDDLCSDLEVLIARKAATEGAKAVGS